MYKTLRRFSGVCLMPIMLVGCERAAIVPEGNCYYRAYLEDENYNHNDAQEIKSKAYFELYDAHKSEDLFHHPRLKNSNIYVGGDCKSVSRWKRQNSSDFLFFELTEEEYEYHTRR